MTVASLPRFYLRAVGAAIAGSASDRVNLVLQILGMIANNGFVLTLWFLFFAGFHSVGGWRLGDMALLVGLIMTMVGVAGIAFGGYRDMAAVILSGEIDALLTQPRSVLARLLARDSLPSAWGDLLVGLTILVASARLRWADAPWLAIGWSFGLAVYLSINIVFASAAFWAAGARSLARDLTEFVILLTSYPGSIYSGAGKLIAYTLLPAGFIVLTPVNLIRARDLTALAEEAVAALLYAALAATVFQLGLRRYRRGETSSG
jgi:ABC-2 type transport system permease protein